MKLVRYGEKGSERPGVLDATGRIRDLSDVVHDISAQSLGAAQFAELSEINPENLPVVPSGVRIGACIGDVGKFICIGLNYKEHAREAGMALPEEPIVFMKATSAICGPNDPIIIPQGADKVDWEVELGVVIGREASYVSKDDALDYVAGYCAVNDVSERAYQTERGGQWTKGKSADSFGPIGPWLVTKDEIADPQNLALWLEVDGTRYQDGSTQTMHFDVAYLVSHLSQFMSLQPGDIIATGTPSGVGMGQKPHPIFLREGQTVRLGIEGLGEQQQRVEDWAGVSVRS
jgi:2-keto-4-pentenoate hydratase/2-oxohepta-3-ene-1,7-dioic acid hydratase in catechol pathway